MDRGHDSKGPSGLWQVWRHDRTGDGVRTRRRGVRAYDIYDRIPSIHTALLVCCGLWSPHGSTRVSHFAAFNKQEGEPRLLRRALAWDWEAQRFVASEGPVRGLVWGYCVWREYSV